MGKKAKTKRTKRTKKKDADHEIYVSSYADFLIIFDHIIQEQGGSADGILPNDSPQSDGYRQLKQLVASCQQYVYDVYRQVYAPFPELANIGGFMSGVTTVHWFVRVPNANLVKNPHGLCFSTYAAVPAMSVAPAAQLTLSSRNFGEMQLWAELLNLASERINSGETMLV